MGLPAPISPSRCLLPACGNVPAHRGCIRVVSSAATGKLQGRTPVAPGVALQLGRPHTEGPLDHGWGRTGGGGSRATKVEQDTSNPSSLTSHLSQQQPHPCQSQTSHPIIPVLTCCPAASQREQSQPHTHLFCS